MESTLLTSFLKASKIKQWLANSQASPIIPEIKSLYNCIYASNNSDDHSSMDDEDQTQTCGLVGLSIPKDIQPLLQNNNSKIHLQARLKCDGIVYSMYQTHRGNSQVFFHPNGNKKFSSCCRIHSVHLFCQYQAKHHIPCHTTHCSGG